MTSHAIRHPREGGGPSPDRQVYPRVPVMDSRLRGNDEVWGGKWGSLTRHPELVCASTPSAPGSISTLSSSVSVARWMLERSHRKVKQVQHDDEGEVVQNLFVSSCELK